MENIRNLVPPEKSVEYNQAVEQHLIDSAWKILYLHYSHYNWIDQKAQRFLTLVGAIEGYFIINFFLNRKFDTTDKS
ncbi:MAG: hypothetical protein LBG52_04730 [Candidatus Peribacteria bacterium]|jgi:hypothetical protein|nr:hypothetical protein [Candidatus Peribacteria bacterium]